MSSSLRVEAATTNALLWRWEKNVFVTDLVKSKSLKKKKLPLNIACFFSHFQSVQFYKSIYSCIYIYALALWHMGCLLNPVRNAGVPGQAVLKKNVVIPNIGFHLVRIVKIQFLPYILYFYLCLHVSINQCTYFLSKYTYKEMRSQALCAVLYTTRNRLITR